MRFLGSFRFSQRKVVPKLKDQTIIEGRVRALKDATDSGRRRLVELIGLKSKLKLAFDRMIDECDRHFESVPGGNIFQVD
jgi:hypothetical protein